MLDFILHICANGPIVSSGTKICNVIRLKDNEVFMVLKTLVSSPYFCIIRNIIDIIFDQSHDKSLS